MILEIVKLAREKKFIPENRSISWKTDDYLWLCELQKWLREKHQLFITINAKGVIDKIVWYNNVTIRTKKDHKFENYYKTYEEALEIGLFEGLKLIK